MMTAEIAAGLFEDLGLNNEEAFRIAAMTIKRLAIDSTPSEIAGLVLRYPYQESGALAVAIAKTAEAIETKATKNHDETCLACALGKIQKELEGYADREPGHLKVTKRFFETLKRGCGRRKPNPKEARVFGLPVVIDVLPEGVAFEYVPGDPTS